MRKLLITAAIVLGWGLAAAIARLPILANLEFIFGLTGFLLLFFKDFDPDQAGEEEKVMRKRWLWTFAMAMLLGLVFGSLWNSHIIAPSPYPDAPPMPHEGLMPGPGS